MTDKERIIKLFKTGKTFWFADIVRELGIDLEMVVDICKELMASGEIVIDQEALKESKCKTKK